MGGNKEVEIKFCVDDLRALTRRLRAAGFRLVTPRTHDECSLRSAWTAPTEQG